MEWLFPPWELWATVATSYGAGGGAYVPSNPSGRADVPTAGATSARGAEPTADDLELIRLMYQIVVTQSCCARCGAPLRGGLRLGRRSAGHPPSWRVSVATRCGGWRRHRHIAEVVDASDGLRFGAFQSG